MTEPIRKSNCKIQYLYNSGFIVETEQNVLIFDLCQESKFITERLLHSKQVTIFVTHNHSDHFNPLIYQWAEEPNVQYVLDKDVDSPSGLEVLTVDADNQYTLNSLKISTLGSTDRGVSFLVEVDGITLFHSGDLNWWKWKGDPIEVQKKEESDYKAEIDKLTDKQIDLAFIPVDPRLGVFYDLAVKYFAETIKVNTIIPMHFREMLEPIDILKRSWSNYGFLSEIVPLTHEGQSFYLEIVKQF